MDELKDNIAKNLIALRTQAHLTQMQLAEMLNYSDKAVSKWERGDAIPDLRVLIRLAEIYGITLDDIVNRESVAPQVLPHKHIGGKRIFITVLCAVLVWFVATGLFALFYFLPQTTDFAYLVFAVAPLPTAIVLTVFSAMWGNNITNAASSSLIVWACAVIFHVFVQKFAPGFVKIYFVYIIAAVFELLIILWFAYRRYIARKRK